MTKLEFIDSEHFRDFCEFLSTEGFKVDWWVDSWINDRVEEYIDIYMKSVKEDSLKWLKEMKEVGKRMEQIKKEYIDE